MRQASTAYSVYNSLRFRSSASAYLSRTPASAGNQQKWTWSSWVKRGQITSSGYLELFSTGTVANNYATIQFGLDNIQLYNDVAGTPTLFLNTTAVYRDPSAWYHIVVAIDTTQATAANRALIYVNGVQATSFSTATYPSQNANLLFNASGQVHAIGAGYNGSYRDYFDGYLAEVNFIDGQALTPSSFGAYNSIGVWQPARYTGTYGTNGFYLKFASFGTAAALGTDSSGNGNTWTVNNISVTAGSTYDPMLDSPTLTSATVANYAVINAVDKNGTVINGNLTATTTSSYSNARATFGVSSGKWYWEQTIDQVTSNNAGLCQVNGGVTLSTYSLTAGSGSAGMWGFQNSNGAGTASWKYDNGASTNSYTVFTTGDIAGFALDMGAGTLAVYRNNTLLFTCSSSLAGNTVYPFVWNYASGQTATSSLNFGQRPFSYTPPSGFVALNAYNLPTPTIANGATVMAATTYTGTGATQSILNSNNTTTAVSFKPDLVWGKCRSTASTSNWLENSIVGAGQVLYSDQTVAEQNNAIYLPSFNSNGFSVAGNTSYFNATSSTYIAWQWQAGQGSTSSNTNGSITSTVSVNATAGFSVVTYTGTGANATVGHGLGVAPSMIMIKNRNNVGGTTAGFAVGHVSLPWPNGYLQLWTTNAVGSASTVWNTSPTSTVFGVGSDLSTNYSGASYVAYCWSAVAGYSAFGSYTGNGSSDGPFIYTGFRPRFVMVKSTGSIGGDWVMIDTSRRTFNVENDFIKANTSDAETAVDSMDILSNGFKMRYAGGASLNYTGENYIYAAFAENPFKYALAR